MKSVKAKNKSINCFLGATFLLGSWGRCWSLSQPQIGEGRIHLNEPPAHCRALCEQLSVPILAQGYLPWFCSSSGLELKTLRLSAQSTKDKIDSVYYRRIYYVLWVGGSMKSCLRIFLVILKSTDVYSYVTYWATLRLCVFSLTLWSGMRQSSTPSWRRNSPTSCVTWPRLRPGSMAMTYRSQNACCPTSWPLRPSRAALGSPLLRTRISMR